MELFVFIALTLISFAVFVKGYLAWNIEVATRGALASIVFASISFGYIIA